MHIQTFQPKMFSCSYKPAESQRDFFLQRKRETDFANSPIPLQIYPCPPIPQKHDSREFSGLYHKKGIKENTCGPPLSVPRSYLCWQGMTFEFNLTIFPLNMIHMN
ncbi:UNVERIFIED_CONTAM: hypothetical protein K2H54_046864 [Gekko kuhli]